VHQDTVSGVSTNAANQSKVQKMVAPSGASQTQYDPLFCCGFASQDGGTGNNDLINQTANLSATGDSFPSQSIQLTGESTQPGDASGTCTQNQFASINGASTPNSATESPCPFLLLETTCSTGEGSFCNPVPPVTTPPNSPVSALTKCVANQSRETQCLGTVPASSDQTLEYQISYRNIGTGTGTNVTVTDVLPAGLTYVAGSCQGPSGSECGYNSGTNTVTFLLGSVPRDSSRSMSFRTTYSCGAGTATNVANGKASEERQSAASNPAVVTNSC
jgi:uncharacterized repeat protein (TIGR01451 family)